MIIIRRGIVPPAAGAGGAYAGPGDVVAARAWWGLRAYSLATVGSNAIRLIRASDSAQQDFVTVTGGGLDLASIATFLSATTGKIVTLYDQTLSGFDVTQATDANRPAFTTSVVGSLPGGTFDGSAPHFLAVDGSTFYLQAQPHSSMIVAKKTGGTGDTGVIGFAAGQIQIGFDTPNNAFLYAGNAQTAAATDNHFYTIQALYNGASGNLTVNGVGSTVDTGPNVWSGGSAQPIFGAGTNNGLNPLTGVALEGGLWAGDISSSFSALRTNVTTYYGAFP